MQCLCRSTCDTFARVQTHIFFFFFCFVFFLLFFLFFFFFFVFCFVVVVVFVFVAVVVFCSVVVCLREYPHSIITVMSFLLYFFPDARYPTVRNPRPQPAAAAVALNRASTRSIKTTKVNSGAGRKRLTLSSSTPFSCLSWLPRVTLR